jgi:hypothetical protein
MNHPPPPPPQVKAMGQATAKLIMEPTREKKVKGEKQGRKRKNLDSLSEGDLCSPRGRGLGSRRPKKTKDAAQTPEQKSGESRIAVERRLEEPGMGGSYWAPSMDPLQAELTSPHQGRVCAFREGDEKAAPSGRRRRKGKMALPWKKSASKINLVEALCIDLLHRRRDNNSPQNKRS